MKRPEHYYHKHYSIFAFIMKQNRTAGMYLDKDKKVTFDLPVLSYHEAGLQVIYAPYLDLFGYGKTEKEAKESFKITLEEFIRYTTAKNTIEKVLKQLGWKIKTKKHLYQAPSLG